MNLKLYSTTLLLCALLLQGCGYKNYEECVLGEMKEQQAAMQSTAEKVCERKFPYEKEIYSFSDGDFDIVWIYTHSGNITLAVDKNETEYKITKAKMKFSAKECDKSKYDDFDTVVIFEFKSGMSATTYSSKADDFRCMRRDSVYGVIN
jgi:hypothetical protein